MRKIVSFLLVTVMLVGLMPTVFANEDTTEHKTKVTYTSNQTESYTVTVPATLDPGGNGNVTLAGTWGSATTVKVTADKSVRLTNNIKQQDYKDLAIYFDGIELTGSNTGSVYKSAQISVANIENALFGAWTGRFEYYISVNTVESGDDNNEQVPDPDDPADNKEMVYYSTINSALNAITSDNIVGDSDANSTTAQVCVYCDAETGMRTIQLLGDLTLSETLNIETDLVVDLNGHEISSNTAFTPLIRTTSNNVIFDGTKSGSAVTVNAPADTKGTILSAMSGALTINGGAYTSNTSGAGSKTSQTQAIYAGAGTTLNISDATVIATDTNNGHVVGINGKDSTELNLMNCDVTVRTGSSLENVGVLTSGSAVLRNCNIIAAADYTGAGNAYTSNSRGIHSKGSLELYDCYVWGSHAGVTVEGSVYVNGGTYEGYGHGAFYLASSDTTFYFYNSTLNWAPMIEGTTSDVIAGTNGAGFYIGGGKSNMSVYIDNCDFNTNDGNGELYKGSPAPYYGIVLRTSGGESNNKVYISNCYVEMANSQMFRGNGTSGNIVYNGIGNDWSKAGAVHKGSESSYIDTNVSYAEAT